MPKELLFSLTKKDFEVQTFQSGGKGGQHQNKTNSGVRIIHKESGAIGESRSERSQLINKKLAFQRLVENPKFKLWMNMKTNEVIKGKTLEQKINEMLSPENIKFETKDENGNWIEDNNAITISDI